MKAGEPVRRYQVRFFSCPGRHEKQQLVDIDHNDPARVVVPEGVLAFQIESNVHVTVEDNGRTEEVACLNRTEGPKHEVAR